MTEQKKNAQNRFCGMNRERVINELERSQRESRFFLSSSCRLAAASCRREFRPQASFVSDGSIRMRRNSLLILDHKKLLCFDETSCILVAVF